MARRVGGWASLFALAAIGCRAGAPAEKTTRGAATASVQIGAETSVDQPAYQDRQGTQVGGWAIPGGPGALIVWEDSGDYSSITGGAEQSIYGARVDTQGALLDRVGFSITPMPQDNAAYPMGAFSVDRWLVIWYDPLGQVRGARVATDGTVLDPNGIDISLATDAGYPMAVVPDANGFVVMWTANVNVLTDFPFYMAKVGFDGTVTPAGGGAVTLPSETPALYVAAAAPVGNQIALMMVSNRLTSPVPKALLVDHTGAAVTALSAAGGPPYASQAGVSTGIANAAASNGSETFVLWQQYATIGNQTGLNTTLVARRLGADGQWIDSAPIQVRAAAGNVGRVGVLWDGTSFICYWVDHTGGPYRAQLYTRRYAPDGTPVDSAPVAITNLASVPYGDVQLTLVGGRVFATLLRTTTTNEGDQSDGILLRVLDATLKPLGNGATIVSAAANGQYLPRAAGAPGGAFVTWVDDRLRSMPTIYGSPEEDIYGALVTPGAAGLAQTVTPLSTTPNTDGDPAVGWDGTRFTVVFRAGLGSAPSGRYLVHVDSTGARTGTMVGPLENTDYSADSLLTWNGNEYLIAWFDGQNSALAAPYEGRRLSSTDALLDATHFTVQPSASPFADVQRDLGGVALGGTFLLTSQGQNNVAGDFDVFGLAVGANGVPATTTGITLANGAGDQDGPAIATDGTSALVLWRDNGAAAGPRILARHVDATLAPLDSDDAVVASATPPDALGPPALAWTGSSYVAVWTTVTGGLISFTGCTLGADRHCVAGTQTSAPSGISAGPSAATVIEVGVGWPGGIQDLSLVWTNTGGVLFYRRFDDDPLVRRLRLYARSVNGTGAAPNDGGVTLDASSTGGRGGSSAGGTGGGSAGRGGTGGAAGAVGGAGRDGGAAGGAGIGGSAGVSGAGGGAGTGGATGTGGGTTGAAGTTGSAGTAGSGATDAGSGAAGGAGGNRDGSAGSGSAGAQGAGGATAGATGAVSSGCSCELSTSNRSTPGFLTLLLALGSRRRSRRRR